VTFSHWLHWPLYSLHFLPDQVPATHDIGPIQQSKFTLVINVNGGCNQRKHFWFQSISFYGIKQQAGSEWQTYQILHFSIEMWVPETNAQIPVTLLNMMMILTFDIFSGIIWLTAKQRPQNWSFWTKCQTIPILDLQTRPLFRLYKNLTRWITIVAMAYSQVNNLKIVVMVEYNCKILLNRSQWREKNETFIHMWCICE
jgi:hypothetical protein